MNNANYQAANQSCMDLLTALPDDHVDLILTDPPYNLGQFMKNRGTQLEQMRPNFFVTAGWDNLDFKDWVRLMDGFFCEASRVVKTGGGLVVFMSLIRVETIIQLATKYGFYYKTTGIWHKTNPMPRNMNYHFINSTEAWLYFVHKAKTGTFNNEGKVVHDFLEYPVAPSRERSFGKHPTQKPVALLERMIELLSNPGELVCDPFMGSGSTGVAALNCGRNFIGSEINSNYYNISIARMNEAVTPR